MPLILIFISIALLFCIATIGSFIGYFWTPLMWYLGISIVVKFFYSYTWKKAFAWPKALWLRIKCMNF